jgi:hydrogenase maturation protease
VGIEDLEGKTIVLGVGNVLLKDEGVGIRAVQELERRYEFPEKVALVDGGTLGLSLLSVVRDAERLIVLDAVKNRSAPGTIHRLTDRDLPKTVTYKTSIHQTDLVEAINICREVFDHEPPVIIIGVEPEDMEPFGVELSPATARAMPQVLERVVEELTSLGLGPTAAKEFDPAEPLPLS